MEHSEQFVGRVGVGTTRLLFLKCAFSHTVALAFERTLEIQSALKFPYLFVREFLLLTDGVKFFLEILLIARNVLIINTNWNGKMTKETN